MGKKYKTRGPSAYVKSAKKRDNQARNFSSIAIEGAIREMEIKKKLENPTKPVFGPRMMIVNYMNEKGFNVSNEEIIQYMQDRMKNADREYILGLIRQIKEEDEKKKKEKEKDEYDGAR